jgi:cytochrome P450
MSASLTVASGGRNLACCLHCPTPEITMVPFDPTDPSFVADPYPTYSALRRDDPVLWWEPGDTWLVSRHADVSALLRDRRLGRVFTPKEPAERFAPWNLLNEHSMLEVEPPDHTRLRRLVSSEFTPRRVEGMRDGIARMTDALLDAAEPVDGTIDLVPVLAEQLPVEVIADLLGIPHTDRHLLRPWSNAIVALYELTYDEAVAQRAIAAAEEFTAYLRDLVARRRTSGGSDLLSALTAASDEGDRLSADEVVATAILLLNAGHEASVNVLSNGFAALLRHPAELARLRRDPSLVRSAVEEFIRYDTPLSVFSRTAFTDVEVAGTTVAQGQRVGLLLGSANHDETVFREPGRFDVGREPNPHVGFGAGIHFCLGAPLARLELVVAVERTLQRFPVLELAGALERRPAFQFRGHRHVPVAARHLVRT